MMDHKIIQIKASLSEQEEPYIFHMYCKNDLLKKTERKQLQSIFEGMIKTVKIKKGLHIYEAHPSYELCEPEKYGPTKKNTIVEVSIPFCLNLPQDYTCKVEIPKKNIIALVHFGKIWTKNSKGSSSVDLFEENNITYFAKTEIITPQVPINDEDGYEFLYQGKNVTKTNDNTGFFRYTKLFIEIDTNYSKEQLKSDGKFGEAAITEITEKIYEIINRIIDIYRFITNENHIERLNSINIRDIYFVNHNLGFYILKMGAGIENAIINRSKREIDKIKEMLENGSSCPIYELLFMNAEASYCKQIFVLAVVESFQALEIFLENFLLSKFKNILSEDEIEKRMDKIWRTKERLKTLLPEVGVKSPLANQNLWDQWCTMYDKIRNEVLHKGKEINALETLKTINLNKEMVKWIKDNT
ncbi:MAG: hypothetical protein ABR969_08305 [Sedimentisphaerales bacterium]|jgi:hypothetical protein